MVRRWAPVLVLLGLLAGCGSPTAGHGTPEAAPVPGGSTSPGLPVPDEPTEPATTSAAPTSTTTAPTTTPPVATPPRTAPAGRPCPADVAATLPDSRSATLVAGFRTSRFRLSYCRTAGGQRVRLPGGARPTIRDPGRKADLRRPHHRDPVTLAA